jgi:hypothetical protein
MVVKGGYRNSCLSTILLNCALSLSICFAGLSDFILNLLQLVQPAFQKLLSHLRLKAIQKFKTGLGLSLESGKSFAASVRDNTEFSLNEFEQGCAGKLPTLDIFLPHYWFLKGKLVPTRIFH